MTLPSLLLIHGANSAGRELAPLADALSSHAQVLTPDLPGHGGRALPEHFSIQSWAEDLLRTLDSQGIEQAVVGGYSLGGYVALYLACHHPQRVRGVLTLATKYIFDAQATRHLMYLTDAQRVAKPGNPRYAELLSLHQPQEWKQVIGLNQQLFQRLGEQPPLDEADLGRITAPALVLSGTTDQIVPEAETVRLGNLLPQGRSLLFPGYAHPLAAVPIPAVVPHVARWLRGLP